MTVAQPIRRRGLISPTVSTSRSEPAHRLEVGISQRGVLLHRPLHGRGPTVAIVRPDLALAFISVIRVAEAKTQ